MHILNQEPSPVLKANCFSRLLFTWIFPLFFKGSKKNLCIDDMYRVLPDDKAGKLGDAIEKAWDEEVSKCKEFTTMTGIPKKPSLNRVLLKLFGCKYAVYGIVTFYEECILKLGQPLCLGRLLMCISNPKACKKYEPSIYAAALVILAALYTTSDHPFTFAVQRLGMKIRISLCSLIYRKALKLSQCAKEATDSGQIVNFLSGDLHRFDVLLTYLHYIWVAPIQLVLVVVVIWLYLGIGISCLYGIILIILYVPFQAFLGKAFSRLRASTAKKTDARIFHMTEILGAMRVIKMCCFENIFIDIISESRKKEIRRLMKTAYLRAANQTFFFISSRVTLFLTLMAYVFLNNWQKPTIDMVFVCLALYCNMQQVMTLYFPFAIIAVAETLVTIKRIEGYLLLKERQVNPSLQATSVDSPVSSPPPKQTVPTPNKGVVVSHIFAKWDDSVHESVIKNVSLELKSGKAVAIIGPTGAGKGSILQVIIGELQQYSGEVNVIGEIAYSSQEPWVFSGSVRENILFGRDFDENWYDTVVSACALGKDIQSLQYGDNTLVGEKGNALSGGQKARVNLARAVYANADIYLLDDPLSAVDAEVGRQIMEQCICGVLKSKAVLLVTHQYQLLRSFDEIILLSNGSVFTQGNYKHVLESGDHFTKVMQGKVYASSVSTVVSESNSKVKLDQVSIYSSSATLAGEIAPVGDMATSFPLTTCKLEHMKSTVEPEEPEEEKLRTGGIPSSLYWTYIKAGSNCCSLLFLVFVLILSQALFSGSDYWLRIWLDTSKYKALNFGKSTEIEIYGGIMISLFLVSLIRTMYFFRVCMNSSVALHRKLFLRVLKSPMLFFETNPVGRIINRFSKDMCVMDETFPATLFDTVDIFLQLIGILVVTCTTSYYLIIPSLALLVMFYLLRKFYFKTARPIKRLEGAARGPVFTHLSTTFDGLTTIRAFKVQKTFQNKFDALQDVHTSAWYLFLACSRTLGIYVDWVSIIFVTAVIICFMVPANGDSATIGLAISSALMLTSMCQWGVRQSAEVENQMIAIERIIDYCNLEQEAAWESDAGHKPPNNWPSTGQIAFHDLCLKYNPKIDHLVLTNINCVIKPHEKIGVVGRTGAGKSSFISSLFRLAEPCGGFVEIDDIDTSLMGLHDLRVKISIIPQEPTLFSTTLRKNLDPFDEYPDSDIWNVLQDVNLADGLQQNELGLDLRISEGGANFSVGQKQLVCLGRAILKRNRILILDEATSNVDAETDEIIQTTIREKFSGCTVIAIAHRLHTVMDSDRMIVLDSGKLIEFDEPLNLLNNPKSALYQLVQQTGKGEAHTLLKIAKRAATKRRLQQTALAGIILQNVSHDLKDL